MVNMKENQNIEFKESWHDEYIKWICGFANAQVFYRAGYIESWGRGVQKIKDACKNLGTESPEYIIHGEDIMIVFTSLHSDTDTLDDTLDDTLESNILNILKAEAAINQTELAKRLNVSIITIKRIMKKLIENNKIERTGGKRFGSWIVNETIKD